MSEPPPRASCKSFVVPNNAAYLGIRINLVGREPDGRIEPGGELDDYCRALTQELLPYIEERFRGIGEGWARTVYGGELLGLS